MQWGDGGRLLCLPGPLSPWGPPSPSISAVASISATPSTPQPPYPHWKVASTTPLDNDDAEHINGLEDDNAGHLNGLDKAGHLDYAGH